MKHYLSRQVQKLYTEASLVTSRRCRKTVQEALPLLCASSSCCVSRSSSRLNGLSKYYCLIIDEVGYCKFNREETLLFFQLIDRISLKETGSIVLTSNKDLSQWNGLFDEDDALECAIDRLWDKAICLTFSGSSHRGNDREKVELNFMKLR